MRTSLLALSLLASSAAFAQTNELPSDDDIQALPDAPANVQYAEKTELIFDGVGVNGTMVGPGLANVSARGGSANFPPMFKLRVDFNTEMAQSANQVK